MGVVESLTLTVLGGSGLVTVLVSWLSSPMVIVAWLSTLVTADSLTVTAKLTLTEAPAATGPSVQVTVLVAAS